MAKIEVKYKKEITAVLDWPEDEMYAFDYEELENNLDNPSLVLYENEEIENGSISFVKVDGKNWDF